MDVVRVDMQEVGMRNEDAVVRGWKEMFHCGASYWEQS